ncbi:hypothetical protein B0H14DRAFT_2646979 [Mycena olivaceomarginata]|nr:hypothetical protein B0H14DRAFT_2646979 [Mycena olivaceomarginata]
MAPEAREALAMGKGTRLGGIANISENHWIAFTIDTEAQVVGYGMGSAAPYRRACARMSTDLPIPKQIDPHSCGILAYFSLATGLTANAFRCQINNRCMADERVKMFLRVVEHHERKETGSLLKPSRRQGQSEGWLETGPYADHMQLVLFS